MKPRSDWPVFHVLRPDLRYGRKGRKRVEQWLRDMNLRHLEDWTYGGFRGVDGQGKRHIFRIRDKNVILLLKLTFA